MPTCWSRARASLFSCQPAGLELGPLYFVASPSLRFASSSHGTPPASPSSFPRTAVGQDFSPMLSLAHFHPSHRRRPRFFHRCSHWRILTICFPPNHPTYLPRPTSYHLPPTCYLPPPSSYLPPPTYLLPPTSYLLLPPTYLLPPTSFHLPATTYLLPPTTYLVPPTDHHPPPTTYLLPPTCYHLPPTTCLSPYA